AMLTAMGFGMSIEARTNTEPEVLRLARNGWMPNNDRLAVLLYRHALSPAKEDPASEFEALFQRNGWPPQWRNGVYSLHHYHSTAHEVLGFAAGSATIILGGENGHQLDVHPGDVALLPAGTGHCKLRPAQIFLLSARIRPASSGTFAGPRPHPRLSSASETCRFLTPILSSAPMDR